MNRHELQRQFLTLGFFAAAIPATLSAFAWIYFLISLDHYTLADRAIGLMVGLLVIFHFIKTSLFVMHRSSVTEQTETLIHMTGLVLTMIGSAWLIWAIHLGLSSADWEYYGLIGAAVTLAQGCLSVLMIRQRSVGLV